MALRDQPYIPLYVQDFLTDEKLIECSAESAGVYIFIMCVMHKSDPYGTILLKQKDKQTGNQIKDFALKLVKHLPYSLVTIERSLTELIAEDVIQYSPDTISQKRMIKDHLLSLKRSEAGSKGGASTQKKVNFAKAKKEAKAVANTEIENVNEIISYLNIKASKAFKASSAKTVSVIKARINEGFTFDDFKKVIDIKSSKWKDDPKMSDYLRPETLFGTKFEGYLNEVLVNPKPKFTWA